MSAGGDLGNPLRKFKLVFLGEQSGESVHDEALGRRSHPRCHTCVHVDGRAYNISPLMQSSGMEGWTWRVCVAGWPVAGCDAHVWHNLRQKEIGLITGVKKRRRGTGGGGGEKHAGNLRIFCSYCECDGCKNNRRMLRRWGRTSWQAIRIGML